jgi:hypothetical protein
MSRVSDFKHHHTDVIAGACLGISVAFFVTFVTGKTIWYHPNLVKLRKRISSVDNLCEFQENDNNENDLNPSLNLSDSNRNWNKNEIKLIPIHIDK